MHSSNRGWGPRAIHSRAPWVPRAKRFEGRRLRTPHDSRREFAGLFVTDTSTKFQSSVLDLVVLTRWCFTLRKASPQTALACAAHVWWQHWKVTEVEDKRFNGRKAFGKWTKGVQSGRLSAAFVSVDSCYACRPNFVARAPLRSRSWHLESFWGGGAAYSWQKPTAQFHAAKWNFPKKLKVEFLNLWKNCPRWS